VCAALTLSGCDALGIGSGASAQPTDWTGKTITVWLMKGDDPAAWTDSVRTDFTRAYPGATVKFVEQQWTDIQQTLSQALAAPIPPDVVEIGNTQTAYYADLGGLLDLSPYNKELGASQWTASMSASTVYKGVEYAAPWYAGMRVVMYDKKLWAAAGLTRTPATRAEWFHDLDVLKATPGVDSALYLPGQNWYAFDGFLQDAGADIITTEDGHQVGDLDSKAALSAAQLFKRLQSYGTAPADQNEANQDAVFAKGRTATMIAMGYEGDAVTAANPKLNGEIGWFPIPGATAAKPAKTFLGGSDLAIPLNSHNRDLAAGFLRIALDDDNEALFAKLSGFLPNRSSLYSALSGNAYAQAATKAADYAGYTPFLPNWGNVEQAPNPITQLFLTPVLEGKDPQAAAKAADQAITSRLSAQ